ncbi:hypothetical protein, partial [Leisingera sp. ANG-M7]|uniref:hypothetical protein n=1 Tax=Leisingera sp. ANG-M7 TaxID=1577902 RepID=UPI0019D40547
MKSVSGIRHLVPKQSQLSADSHSCRSVAGKCRFTGFRRKDVSYRKSLNSEPYSNGATMTEATRDTGFFTQALS